MWSRSDPSWGDPLSERHRQWPWSADDDDPVSRRQSTAILQSPKGVGSCAAIDEAPKRRDANLESRDSNRPRPLQKTHSLRAPRWPFAAPLWTIRRASLSVKGSRDDGDVWNRSASMDGQGALRRRHPTFLAITARQFAIKLRSSPHTGGETKDMITLRLPRSIEERLRAQADDQGITLAAYMRLVVNAGEAQLEAARQPAPTTAPQRRRILSRGVDG